MTSGSSKSPGSSFGGDFAPGEVLIGRYRIVALIGDGGMGQVYLADNLVLGQSVAVAYATAVMTTASIVLTLRPSDWRFSPSVMILGAMAALALWAYRVSVAGRSAFE